MRLSLSSAAAPDAALAELVAACARRGLTALELAEDHAHGVSAGMDDGRVEAVYAATRDSGVGVCALYRETIDAHEVGSAARTAAALGAPLVTPAGAVQRDLLREAARAFAGTGAELLLACGSDPAAVEMLRRSIEDLPGAEAIGIAWELRPHSDDPLLVDGVQLAAGRHLRYVRLYGGGPESAQQTGLGVGVLVARLTLARYTGPLVLTPSTPRYHHAWRFWLGRAGGWGCGSRQSDPSLVLERETLSAGIRP